MEKREKELIILDTSDEAAQYKTVTGWVSRSGRFYGEDERAARYEGGTHTKCECGNLCTKSYAKCDKCIAKDDRLRYLNFKFQEWDGETPVTIWNGDKYFFDEQDIIDYCEDNKVEAKDLMLVICDPNYADQINEDYWEDVLPEDGEMSDDIKNKLKELNELIEKSEPISWSQSKVRTEFIPHQSPSTPSKMTREQLESEANKIFEEFIGNCQMGIDYEKHHIIQALMVALDTPTPVAQEVKPIYSERMKKTD